LSVTGFGGDALLSHLLRHSEKAEALRGMPLGQFEWARVTRSAYTSKLSGPMVEWMAPPVGQCSSGSFGQETRVIFDL
tara:strand:+ start:3653 stop:3886 length:234 start_codon:yes stop_codon:yes gene_type:complete